jgi:hypothetical protein
MDLTSEMISAFGGILLSLILNYVPGLNVKFAALSSEIKSAIVAGSLVVIGVLVALSSCGNLWVWISCDQVGFMKLAQCILFALIANQGIYKLSPQTPAVTASKDSR